MINQVLTVEDKRNEKFLRRKTEKFDFNKFSRREINELVSKMRRVMRAAHGIGLSANQVGLNLRMFVAEVPNPKGGHKFYAIFNPKIEKASGETLLLEEGCLSVPCIFGTRERRERVVLSGFDMHGKPLKIKAWGLLAHIFQHETEHLDGKLFIDGAKELHAVDNVTQAAREARQKRYGIES